MLGLPSIGLDSSPVAVALAGAKLPKVQPAAVVRAAEHILENGDVTPEVPSGTFWRLAYHGKTLAKICRFRQALMHDCRSDACVVLRAIVMGALHGPVSKGPPSYFSNQCMRTFAPKPAYAVRFWTKRKMTPPKVQRLLDIIRRRADRYLSDQPESGFGSVVLGDSRDPSAIPQDQRFSLVITSPPYYGMRTYIPDQWIRYWFVGGPAVVEYDCPKEELNHHSGDEFIEQLATVWSNVRRACKRDARMVIRFGGIRDRRRDPMQLLRESIGQGGWRITTTRQAGNANWGKRQAAEASRPP